MLHPNPEILLRIAQGDSYGAPFEHEKDARYVRTHNDLTHFARHQRHKLGYGCYTDDAQMSIGTAETLVSGLPLTREAFTGAFVRAFKRDPRPGYSGGFQKFLEGIRDEKEFLAKIRPDSEKNGAAMRAVPIGVIREVPRLLDVAAIQAAVTHDTRIGIFSSQAVALMSHFALYEKDGFDRLGEYCAAYLDSFGRSEFARYAKIPWNRPIHSPATNTVHAVHTILRSCGSIKEVLVRSVAFMGDTDSVASIAAGIASSRLRDPLPSFLERDLEPGGAYGPAYLKDLSSRLMNLYA